MEENLDYWSSPGSVEKFSSKTKGHFFPSERHFLELVRGKFNSVLDIGCASGRVVELLNDYCETLSYTGVDIVEQSIKDGTVKYPDARFIQQDALNLDLQEQFDLVYAIGVFQHVPAYLQLLDKFYDWSRRFVIFDIKIANVENPIVDLDRSYCVHGEHRTPMILLDWHSFLERIMKSENVPSVKVWGYETPTNKMTHIAEELLPVCSATLLIEKGKQRYPDLTTDLPNWLER